MTLVGSKVLIVDVWCVLELAAGRKEKVNTRIAKGTVLPTVGGHKTTTLFAEDGPLNALFATVLSACCGPHFCFCTLRTVPPVVIIHNFESASHVQVQRGHVLVIGVATPVYCYGQPSYAEMLMLLGPPSHWWAPTHPFHSILLFFWTIFIDLCIKMKAESGLALCKRPSIVGLFFSFQGCRFLGI